MEGPDGQARSIASLVDDIGPETLSGLRATLEGVDMDALPVVPTDNVRIGAPMAQPRNIYCIGLNYSDHAAEAGQPVPEQPILFNKSSGAYCGPNDGIPHADHMTKLDWEVELGVVIGKTALGVSEADALDHVWGYVTVNDVSERSWQIERGGQWTKGKSYPNFCPTGPWLVSADAVGDVQALDLRLEVNGERMQTGTTAKMVFGVAEIVSHLSQFLRLEPGDLICTGTPPGVGMGMSPQKWLVPGDEVELEVAGLGVQRQRVVAA